MVDGAIALAMVLLPPMNLSPVLAFVAVLTENTDQRLERTWFAGWLASLLAFAVVTIFLADGVALQVLWPIWATLGFFFYRALVQRARDAGLSKMLAYIAVVPAINIPIYLYLLVRPARLPLARATA